MPDGLVRIPSFLSRIAAIAAVAVAGLTLPQQVAAAVRISAVRIWPAEEYTRLTLEAPAGVRHRMFAVKNPERLVLDLEDADSSPALESLAQKIQPNDPYIKAVRVGRFKPGVLRMVLDLKTEVKPNLFLLPPVGEYGHRLVLDIYPAVPVDPLMALLRRGDTKHSLEEAARLENGMPAAPPAVATDAAHPPAARTGGPRAPVQVTADAPPHQAAPGMTGQGTAAPAAAMAPPMAPVAGAPGGPSGPALPHSATPPAGGAPALPVAGAPGGPSGPALPHTAVPATTPPALPVAGAPGGPSGPALPHTAAAATPALPVAGAPGSPSLPALPHTAGSSVADAAPVAQAAVPSPGPVTQPDQPGATGPQHAAPPTVAETEGRSPPPAARADAAPHPLVDRLITVAVDAGHGGEDPGARGHSALEKNVTLQIARRLKAKIDEIPNMRGVLVRDGDYFIPLAGRTDKARRLQADLFVSVHADSFVSPDARGSSVFALSERGATSAAARWLAKRENEADLIGGVNLSAKDPNLARTLLDLSQTATINDSLKLARAVLRELGGLNTLHKGEVEQAGFAVLKSPDIPSILVETAFISNPEEERRLADSAYQDRMAGAIVAGIRRFLAKNPPLARGAKGT